MMDYSDRHFRHILRALTRHTLIYSEMIHANAIVRGGRVDLLHRAPDEGPLALQLGGDDPSLLAEAAKIAEDLGWDEVNLNVGCPSERVQRGRFGACLMASPDVVAACVDAMRARVRLPVTVKHRIGIDEHDRYEDLLAFVDRVLPAGPDRLTVHARKAWLSGLSPRENRTIPPLRYEDVYRLKSERRSPPIEINGGVKSLPAAQAHLQHVDAVMVGRVAYEDPWALAEADTTLFGATSNPATTRTALVHAVLPYLAATIADGTRPHAVIRHLLGLYTGTPLAKAWKRGLTPISALKGSDTARAPALLEALAQAALRSPSPRAPQSELGLA